MVVRVKVIGKNGAMIFLSVVSIRIRARFPSI